MKLENITGIIFDLGGTLYRPVFDMCRLTREFMVSTGLGEDQHLTDERIVAATKAPNDWLTKYMIENNVGMHWQPDNNQWLEYDRILLEQLGIADQEHTVLEYQKRWDEFHEAATPELMEGCIEGLEELKNRGFKLGVASNRFKNPTQVLETSKISHFFDAIEYTGVPGYRKPSPYMLLMVAAAFGTNPQRCVYVGNIVEYDVVSATRAGMIPILLTWCDPDEEEKVTADTVVIEHISDLLEIL
jgi:HAD superfamily hydrolase (TIGR01549 family)